MLQFKNVSKKYGNGHNAKTVLKKVSLVLNADEIIFVCGHNGSGKSTLFKIISGIEEPEPGSDFLFIHNDENRAWNEIVKKNSLLIPQSIDDVVANQLTISEFISLFPTADIDELTKSISIKLLKNREKNLLGELSGGERQLLFGLVALSKPRNIFLLDEVFSDLDQNKASLYWEAISQKKSDNVCIVIVTHDLKMAYEKGDRLIIMNNGRISDNTTPSKINFTDFVKKATVPVN